LTNEATFPIEFPLSANRQQNPYWFGGFSFIFVNASHCACDMGAFGTHEPPIMYHSPLRFARQAREMVDHSFSQYRREK
jgi:hypothetical protein